MTSEMNQLQKELEKTLFTNKKVAEVAQVSAVAMQGIFSDWISRDVAIDCHHRLKDLYEFYRNELLLTEDERSIESSYSDIAEMANSLASNIEMLEELAQKLGYQLSS